MSKGVLTNTAYLNSIKHKVRKDFIRIEFSDAKKNGYSKVMDGKRRES